MYCSNKKFIDIAIATGVQWSDLYDILSVISVLLKKYGTFMKSKKLQDIISQENPQIGKIISLLQSIDRLQKKDIKMMLRRLSKSFHKTSFIINGNERSVSLIEIIQKKFADAVVSVEINKNNVLQVSGEWFYYKRGLNRDLGKILP